MPATYTHYWRVSDADGTPRYDCLDQAEAVSVVNIIYRHSGKISALEQKKVKAA